MTTLTLELLAWISAATLGFELVQWARRKRAERRARRIWRRVLEHDLHERCKELR